MSPGRRHLAVAARDCGKGRTAGNALTIGHDIDARIAHDAQRRQQTAVLSMNLVSDSLSAPRL